MVALVADVPAGTSGGGRFGARGGRIRTDGARPVAQLVAQSPVLPPAQPRAVARPRPPARLTRLTRRGRMAVTGVSALLVGALSVALATSAEAAHGGPGPVGRYVARVQVLPGESLWSLAEAYDPTTDPRQVVARIRQLNSMAGAQVQAGQLLWVPRGLPGRAGPRPALRRRQDFWLRYLSPLA